MQGELFYGNDGLFNWNDSNASGKPDSPAFGQQEGGQVTLDNQPHLDLNNSNSKLDKYLFYFSSKL